VKPFADVMMTWVCALYCRRVHSSYEVAKRTVQLLRNIVSTLKYSSAKELVEKVREIGRDLVAAQPSEGTIGNMVRRVLKIIREEHATCCGKADEVESQPVSCFIKLYYEPKVVKPR
jgi:translation initiation factor eIF-2B subunit beta